MNNTNIIHLSGKVISGEDRGKKIGFATANILADHPDLVNATYVVKVFLADQEYMGAGVYLPSKGHFEVHILDFDEEIYGERLDVEILETIRENDSFDSDQKLANQIRQDIQFVRTFFAKKHSGE